MFKKTNILKYWISDRLSYDEDNELVPGIRTIPEWYKKAKSTVYPAQKHYKYDGETEVTFSAFIDPSTQEGATFKRCMPMLDAMTLGYMITLGEDIHFDENSLTFTPDTNAVQQVTHTPYEHYEYPAPDWCHNKVFKWNTCLRLEIPPNYSALYITPMHRADLPFFTLPGVVDSGHPLTVNTPMMMKKGFSGIIPKGTPIVQIILVKNEPWKSKNMGFSSDFRDNGSIVNDFFEFNDKGMSLTGVYKRKVRKKKDFS